MTTVCCLPTAVTLWSAATAHYAWSICAPARPVATRWGFRHCRSLLVRPGRAQCGLQPRHNKDNACPCRAILIDLSTGHRTTLSNASERAAAFSPDGKQVAIQVHGQIVLTDTAGHQIKQLPAAGAQLTSGHAWSPDGRFLALTLEDEGMVEGVRFLAVAPEYAPPTALTSESVNILGWTDPQHVVTYDHKPKNGLVVHDLTAGTQEVLSTVNDGVIDDIATNLLPQLVTIDGGRPDYGPQPAWVARSIIGVTAILAALVAVAFVLVMRCRRRKGP
ncbi:TolB family protein [Micromonospora musae]|uniref:TolB family protein n=1 Tax=Micromonospora musae TaxID=1894970 RepID=UPI0033DE4F37